MCEKIYCVMDAKAEYESPDKAIVHYCGDAQECCEVANRGDYGKDCVIYGQQENRTMMEWFATGEWEPWYEASDE